jgi:hypothetical protein
LQRDDESGVYTGWRERFVRTDLHLTQQIRPGFELTFGTDNMLDQRPANWSGVTQRRAWLGLSWNRSTGIN